METLIDNTLSCLGKATKIADLRASFTVFLEGMKNLSSENSNLKAVIRGKSLKISALEEKVEELLQEKVDIINSIEFNAQSIKNLESAVSKINLDMAKAPSTNQEFKDSIDSTNQYARRGALTMAGKNLPTFDQGENTKEIVIDQLRRHANYNLSPNDISIAH